MKRLFIILVAASLLCGCVNVESNTTEEDTAMSSVETTEVSQITEEEKQNFATGAATDEPSENEISENVAEEITEVTELNNEIEERCPVIYTANRNSVEYGEYVHGTYYSETCKMDRGFNILLPADYSEEKQYPVMYLLHGIFGNEFSFSGDPNSKIRQIVGNMAADGLIRETIIVCPNMYATDDPNQQPDFTMEACLPYDNFINDLVNDFMPFIESNYSVLTGRENTYLAGFSMGGRETIFIALNRPELFGYVCAISAAPGIVPTKDRFMTHEGQMEEADMKFSEDAIEPEIFMICCGTRDSVVGTYPKSYHEILEKNGSAHIWYEITGADHDNNAIHCGLYNIFKQIAYAEKNYVR